MFRTLGELKGLVIDIDSLWEERTDCKCLLENYHCIFITSDKEHQQVLKEMYGECYIYEIEDYTRWLIPNKKLHAALLQRMQVVTTELAYVSANWSFLTNAMQFFSGTIWITNKHIIMYEQASISPDMICSSIQCLNLFLKNNVNGFYGEMKLFPVETNGMQGIILPVQFDINKKLTTIYTLGRYFGYSHYMNQLHPYSSAIYWNKEGKKTYLSYNEIFAELYGKRIERLIQIMSIDGICAVPARPSEESRFSSILQEIAIRYNLEDISPYFKCNENYRTQKELGTNERQSNVKGVFSYCGDLTGKNILLLDDIITTGATIKECIQELKRAGANQVKIIVLGINQLGGTYWSSQSPKVACPSCKQKMKLFVNSKNKKFFYSCSACNRTLTFEEGWRLLEDSINAEFDTKENNEND